MGAFQGIRWTQTVTGKNIGIGPLPGRKKIALYEVLDEGVVYRPLAYFCSEEDAEKAISALDAMIPVPR